MLTDPNSHLLLEAGAVTSLSIFLIYKYLHVLEAERPGPTLVQHSPTLPADSKLLTLLSCRNKNKEDMDNEENSNEEEAKVVEVKSLSSSSSSSPTLSQSLDDSDSEDLQRMPLAPPRWMSRKRLSKQLSMVETKRDMAWERRRRQFLRQVVRRKDGNKVENDDLTDGDLHELKGCIELGFGFNEEDGQQLCNTLPALDMYFAVNRQLSTSPVSSPHRRSTSSLGGPSPSPSSSSLGGRSSSFGSPKSEQEWKICSPGDNPQQVKTKLRHWAQVVACSVMQSH